VTADTIPGRSVTSRLLHRLDNRIAHASSGAVVALMVLAFFVVWAIVGFPESWEFVFSTVASAITLVMVFLLQHTQRRDQAAIQLKLDELVRATPAADDHFVAVQAAGDAELFELEQRQMDHHVATREHDGDN
jgi:low affinity Fe/Cu permease